MDYQTWFRKWNNLVYEWLNVYLYADIKSVSAGRQRRARDVTSVRSYVFTFVCGYVCVVDTVGVGL